jgi:cytochrome c-type biogenesis protein CcmF
MIVELGHFALILACFVALIQATLPLWGAQRGIAPLMALARPAAQTQFLLVLGAFLALVQAFVASDFSVGLVVQNSHSLKPLLYKITGVWGNHEGSMVLWVLILTLFGALVATFGDNLPAGLQARALSVQAMIAFGFLLFIVVTSNPFLRVLQPPADGQGLNPVLQDPGLASIRPSSIWGMSASPLRLVRRRCPHPGRVDPAWARWVRPWALSPGVRSLLGSPWGAGGHYELGWGGWWSWDPVENASFMPWLAGTALLHSALVVEKRDALKIWTVLLAIIAFSFSLIGTFLVRSGVLSSVHAFANDPARGIFILMLLTIAIGGSLALFAVRAPALKDSGLFVPLSREGGLLLNNLFLSVAAGVVFFGTLFPLFASAFDYTVSVGAPFFNLVFGVLMTPFLCMLPLGPLLAWKRADLLGAAQRIWVAGLAAALVVILLLYAVNGGPVLAIFGLGLAAWLIVGAFADLAERIKLFRTPPATSWSRLRNVPRATLGMTLAHGGLGIVVAGIVAASAWRAEQILVMRPGQSTDISGYSIEFQSVGPADGPNYSAERGEFVVSRDGHELARLHPERRFYPVQRQLTTESAIRTTGFGDLYVVLGEDQGNGARGAHLSQSAGAVDVGRRRHHGDRRSGFADDRRYRVGVPGRRRAPSATADASA